MRFLLSFTAMNRIFLCLVGFLLAIKNPPCFAQSKKLTLEDVTQNAALMPKLFGGYYWLNDKQLALLGTTQAGTEIYVADIATQKKQKTIVPATVLNKISADKSVDDFMLSDNRQFLLLFYETEKIYRYSEKSVVYVYNTLKNSYFVLSNGDKIMYATFSPNGKWVAYVKNNNLYVTHIETQEEQALTYTGELNVMINGASDWVYEEEFELTRAFEWSANSEYLAYLTFDESAVPEYSLQMWQGVYPKNYTYKYPKAGEKNAEVSLHVYSLKNQTTIKVFNGAKNDLYIPRIRRHKHPSTFAFDVVNRNQDSLWVYHYNGDKNQTQLFLTLASPYYVEVDDYRKYLADGTLIYASEHSGYRHIYQTDTAGNTKAITSGAWEVTDICHIDEKKGMIYYTSHEAGSMENHLYQIFLPTLEKKRITISRGVHRVEFNPYGSYYINTYHHPQGTEVYLCNANGNTIKTLEANKDFYLLRSTYELPLWEHFEWKKNDTTVLNVFMVKPTMFDSTQKHPVLFFVYGGPGSQLVTQSWKGRNHLWFEYLAQRGWVVACVDNRGTGGKGEKFRSVTTRQLGVLEAEDQLAFARWLKEKTYVDTARMAIFGWSYGGYMSSLCMLLGGGLYQAAIAVAPVTDWRFYDTIYTERYLKSPKDNVAGYTQTTPRLLANRLKGHYLLIHGTADDNVHLQHAIEMQNALIAANKSFDCFYYPNRNHGIYGGNTRLHLYKLMTDFLMEKLAK